MTGLAVIFLAGLLAFVYPIAGITVWLIAMTVGAKTVTDYHLNTSWISLADTLMAASILRLSMPALGRVIQGRFRRFEPIYVLLWIMSVVVIVAGVFTRGLDQTAILKALWFGPLLLALYQLGGSESRRLLLALVGVAALVSGTAVAVSLFKGGWLASHVQVQLQMVTADATPDTADARVVVPGIWTLVPFGFWVCLALLVAGKVERGTRLYLAGCMGVIFLGLVVNYSRSIAVPLAAGGLALTVASALLAKSKSSKRALVVVGCLVLLGCLTFAVRPTIRENWAERFFGEKRYGTVGARISASNVLYEELQRKGEIIAQAPGIYLYRITRSGDPLAPLLVWYWAGFVGMVVFSLFAVAIPFGAVRRAISVAFRHKALPWQSIVSIGYVFYFFALLLSGFYFSIEMLFPLVAWHWIASTHTVEEPELPIQEAAPEALPA